MGRAAWAQQSFTGGEFHPILKARSDAERYKDAVEVCENFVITAQGPATRRMGTRYVAPVKTPTQVSRMIGFEFNTVQAYVIEMGPLYFRFFKDHAAVTLTAATITGITQASPGVVTTSAAHGLANGDRFIITGVAGMVEVNNREFKAAGVTATTVQLTDPQTGANINTTGYTAYSSGGTTAEIYEVVHTYTEAELPDVQYCSSGDVIYIAHRSHAPAKLSRTGHTSWTLADVDFQEGPFLQENDTTTTLTCSAGTAPGSTCTVTASAITGINNDTGFQTTDVGRRIRIATGQQEEQCWGIIEARGSTTSITVRIKGSHSSGSAAEKKWRLGVYYTGNYPGSVSFHESRLWWGGTPNEPLREDGSYVSDFEDYKPTEILGNAGGYTSVVTDACACAFSLASNYVNHIHWLMGDDKGLLSGNRGCEFITRASNEGDAITPTSVNARDVTLAGSEKIRPVRAGNAIVFVGRGSRRLMEFAFFFETNSFRAAEMTEVARHVSLSGMTALAYQRYPQSIVWGVNATGELCGMSYERGPDSVRAGWHRHILGGAFSGGDAVVMDLAVIPSPSGAEEELWVQVKRTINGSTVKYFEYVTPQFNDDVALEDGCFLDASLTYDSTATTTISGLFHLEGQTVQVVGDGAIQADKTVTNGKITITSASVVHVGFNYESLIKTLRVEAASEDGPSIGKVQKYDEIALRVHRSLGTIQVGTDSTRLRDFALGASLRSDFVTDSLDNDHSRETQIQIKVTTPTPFTLMAICPQVSTSPRN